MFELMTEEKILQDMLDNASPLVDKREGSIVHDQLKPSAIKIAEVYNSLDTLLKIMYVDTSFGDYLIGFGRDRGIIIEMAIASERSVSIVGSHPPIGSRFFNDTIYWEYIAENVVKCETPGEVGNTIPLGINLIPTTYIDGFESMSMGDVILAGTEQEEEEAYRGRIIDKINNPQLNNNINQLKAWALAIKGVGDSRVLPLWNGDGTTKLILIGPTKLPISDELAQQVKIILDPPDANGRSGTGNGKCDIGCNLTVISAIAKTITISASITKSPNILLSNILIDFKEQATLYLRGLAFKEYTILYTKLASILSNIEGVLDYNLSLFKVNNGNVNIILTDSETPVLGVVTIT